MHPTTTSPPDWSTLGHSEATRLLLQHSRFLFAVADEPLATSSADFWHGAFTHFFLETTRPETDDLLFFVQQQSGVGPNPSAESAEPFFVRRNHPDARSTLPLPREPRVAWEESFFLNALCNCFEYTLSFAVCAKRTASVVPSVPASMDSAVHRASGETVGFLRRWRVLHCISKRVYATPSRARMDGSKAHNHTSTYPEIHFAVDDFEHVFRDAVVRSRGEFVCVEIVARGALLPVYPSREVTVFEGAVGYDILKSELANKSEAGSDSFFKGLFGKKTTEPTFFSISGPGRKGKAQMAILPVQAETQPQAQGAQQQTFLSRMFGPKTDSGLPLLSINCSLISISLDWKIIIMDLMSTKQSPTIMSSVVSRALQSPLQSRSSLTISVDDVEEELAKADFSQTV